MRSIWMTLLLATLSIGSAFACPPGQWLQQGVGWQMCVPIPGMQGNATEDRPAAPTWADRWGAIAANETTIAAGIGSSSGWNRRRQAEAAALKACRQKGISGCKVKFTYYNQCVAVVWGDNGSNVSSAASIALASQIGMEKCEQSEDTNCEVYFSECSYPERLHSP